MKYGINTLDDFDFGSKVVLCRLDLNSPFDREKECFKDISRIKAAVPTVKELSEKGASLVLLTHQGGDLEYKNFIPTELHARELSVLLGSEVNFIDDICGPAAREAMQTLKDGEIILLDNVRYMAEEMTLFETKLKLTAEEQAKTIVIRKLAPFADIYVCDAFAAAHRDQPTLVAFEEVLPSAMGRLFEREYEVLSKIMTSPDKPCVFLLGGAKVEDAFLMLPTVLREDIADKILCAGLVAQIFMLAADRDIGAPSREIISLKKLDPYVDTARDILDVHSDRIVMPQDYAYVDEIRKEIDATSLPVDHVIGDIGIKTINHYKEEISGAKTVFVNGPSGISEKAETELGTKELWAHIAAVHNFSVIGGGDSIAAVNAYGLASGFSYMCTGGGALVRFLSGEELPVVRALKKSAAKFKS